MDELEIIQYQQVKGLNVFVNTVIYRSSHFHQEWELLWVLDSPLKVTCMQQTLVVNPGEVVLFPPNMTHEMHQTDQSCTFLCLQISPQVFSDATNVVASDIRLEPYLTTADYYWVKKTALEIAHAYFYREPYYEMYCLGNSGLLLHRLVTNLDCYLLSAEEAKQFEQQNARLLHLVSFVEENYMHKIRLQDFAEQEGCSVSYLSHFIKNTMNQTFQEYVDSVRFARACKLINTSNKTMVEVSNESGFSDYRYFSRGFKKNFGMTPAEYSRQAHAIVLDSDAQSHSVHSQEKMLTRSQSLQILKRFQDQLSQTQPQ